MTEERKIELLKMRFASEKEAKQMAKKLGPAVKAAIDAYNANLKRENEAARPSLI